jgi:hypothetical protein
MTRILAMPYFKNEAHKSGEVNFGHEAAVAVKIAAAGFIEIQKDVYPTLTKSLLKHWAETGDDTNLRTACAGLAEGSYILQPAGSQGFPDILVKDYSDRFVAIECKSGQNGVCPMWNDNTPKPNTIYVLSSGTTNSTTIFMGKDVISPEEQELMNEQESIIKQIVEGFNTRLAMIDKFSRGWSQKSRKQHFQMGGGEKTNYFTHSSRKYCEDNALAYSLE